MKRASFKHAPAKFYEPQFPKNCDNLVLTHPLLLPLPVHSLPQSPLPEQTTFVNASRFLDFQTVRIQETQQELPRGSIPRRWDWQTYRSLKALKQFLTADPLCMVEVSKEKWILRYMAPKVSLVPRLYPRTQTNCNAKRGKAWEIRSSYSCMGIGCLYSFIIPLHIISPPPVQGWCMGISHGLMIYRVWYAHLCVINLVPTVRTSSQCAKGRWLLTAAHELKRVC